MPDQQTKLIVIDTMQYFEIEVPVDTDVDDFIDSDACRMECAEKITEQITDLKLDRIYTRYNENTGWTYEDGTS